MAHIAGAGIGGMRVFEVEVEVAGFELVDGDTPGLLVFHAGGKAVGFVAPPSALGLEFRDADGFALVVALGSGRIGMLVIPNLLGGRPLGEEQEVGADTGLGVEHAVGKPDDRVEVALGQERFLYAGLDAFAEEGAVGQNQPRPSAGFEDLKKRQVRSPKVYVRDAGLLHALLGVPDVAALQGHPKLGASWAGFCLEQILHVCGDRSAYFWGTHGGVELDVLLLHGGRRLGFEFKFSDQPGTTKFMCTALQDLALAQLCVVHPGEHELRLAEAITAIPIRRPIELLELSPAAAW